MRRVPFVAVVLLLVALPATSASRIAGLWDAVVVADQVEIPFRFEIAQNGAQVQGFFFEGDRKIGSTSGAFDNGKLKLEYDFLNTTFEATFDGDQFRGLVRRTERPPLEIRGHRFAPVAAGTAQTPQIAGNWVMYRTAQTVPSSMFPGGCISVNRAPRFLEPFSRRRATRAH